MIVQYGLGFSAGVLSLLAPCVLPILPISITQALKSSKWGPLANAIGLAISFTLFGILTSIFSSFFSLGIIQNIGAVILVLIGLTMIIPSWGEKFSNSMKKISFVGNDLQGKVKTESPILKEFLLGFVLGMVWGPCSGPTLGIAYGIASQAGGLFQASMIFLFFGLGAGFGLLMLGFMLKKFSSLTGFIMKRTKQINMTLGIISIILGALILTGQLLVIEEAILDIMPSWLIRLSSRI